VKRTKAESYESGAEDQKALSASQLLVKCARLLNAMALARIRTRAGAPKLRASHAALLPHLDPEGTRLTDLATRMGVTKQAVGQLVEEMEQMGVLTRSTDQEDRRAKRVRLSTKGRRGTLQGAGILGEIEEEVTATLGHKPMQALQAILGDLLEVLQSDAGQKPGAQSKPGGPRERRQR
jgi:DNA-binding MarR family transcriptional regulator